MAAVFLVFFAVTGVRGLLFTELQINNKESFKNTEVNRSGILIEIICTFLGGLRIVYTVE